MAAATGSSQKGAEGRRVPRTPVDLEAVVGGRAPRKARVADLSLVGCLVRSEKAFARGAVLDLTLAFPDGPLRAKARVVESSLDGEAPGGPPSYLAGLEFVALAAGEEARLRSFLEAEAKRRRGAHSPPA
jgi:hypothetical protein